MRLFADSSAYVQKCRDGVTSLGGQHTTSSKRACHTSSDLACSFAKLRKAAHSKLEAGRQVGGKAGEVQDAGLHPPTIASDLYVVSHHQAVSLQSLQGQDSIAACFAATIYVLLQDCQS